ncbi:MAG: gfo/Idh/MocA family oxidoreductase [Thermoprotei archaeon]|nr:MAG: gfo/Idh/MocA family oxidoreductase [Thermoprotei archaeon]
MVVLSMELKVGFIGCSGIAKRHMANLSKLEGVKLAAFCDVVPKKAVEAALTYGGRAYSDYRGMLRREELDAVYVCTPPYAHGFEVEVAERGIHLFVEKPVAMDLRTALEVERAIEKAGVLSSVGYMLRYSDLTELMRSKLRGEGPPGMVLGYLIDNFKLPLDHWVLDRSKSGGQVVEHTTHIFDLARYVVGDVSRVYAEFDNILLRDIPGITMENEAITILRFKNGAVGVVCGIWSSPDTHTFMRLEVYCKDVVLEHGVHYLRVYSRDEVYERRSNVDFYMEEDRAFVEAVRKDRPELIKCPYEDGVKTLKVTLAANEAASTGRVVAVD